MFKQMKKLTILTLAIMACNLSNAQESKGGKSNFKLVSESPQPINPSTLWDLGRVSAEGLSADGKTLVYGVSNYNWKAIQVKKIYIRFHWPMAPTSSSPIKKAVKQSFRSRQMAT
jgi:hypothetical protein